MQIPITDVSKNVVEPDDSQLIVVFLVQGEVRCKTATPIPISTYRLIDSVSSQCQYYFRRKIPWPFNACSTFCRVRLSWPDRISGHSAITLQGGGVTR